MSGKSEQKEESRAVVKSRKARADSQVQKSLVTLHNLAVEIETSLLGGHSPSATKNTNFNKMFCEFLGLSTKSDLTKQHADFLLIWRCCYVKFLLANSLQQAKKLEKAIEVYEQQIISLNKIPASLLENLNYQLITKHSLAKAYYQLGVLYREQAKKKSTQAETILEEDSYDLAQYEAEQETHCSGGKSKRAESKSEHDEDFVQDESEAEEQISALLLQARTKFTQGLQCYGTDVLSMGYTKDIERNLDFALLENFDTDSVRERIAALFLNLADIEESLANFENESLTEGQEIFYTHYQKAFEALPKKVRITELHELIIAAVDYHQINPLASPSKKQKSEKKISPKSKSTKEEVSADFSGQHSDFLSPAEAIGQFSQAALPKILRPHQQQHINTLKKKCLFTGGKTSQSVVREFGIISATGSGKTLCMLTMYNNFIGQSNKSLIAIIIVPTQNLIDQTVEAIKKYSRMGLKNLPKNDQRIGKWYASDKIIRPLTLITYASYVASVKESLKKIPSQAEFNKAVEKNPRLLSKPHGYFSPFNKNLVKFFDEAHHVVTANSYLAAFALDFFSDQSAEFALICQKLVPREKNEKNKGDGRTQKRTNLNQKELIQMLSKRRRSPEFQSSSERPLIISATATPVDYYEDIFCIDSEYGIADAINDDVAPSLQIIEIRLSDPGMVSSLNKSLGKTKGEGESAKLSTKVIELIMPNGDRVSYNSAGRRTINAPETTQVVQSSLPFSQTQPLSLNGFPFLETPSPLFSTTLGHAFAVSFPLQQNPAFVSDYRNAMAAEGGMDIHDSRKRKARGEEDYFQPHSDFGSHRQQYPGFGLNSGVMVASSSSTSESASAFSTHALEGIVPAPLSQRPSQALFSDLASSRGFFAQTQDFQIPPPSVDRTPHSAYDASSHTALSTHELASSSAWDQMIVDPSFSQKPDSPTLTASSFFPTESETSTMFGIGLLSDLNDSLGDLDDFNLDNPFLNHSG